MTDFSKVLEQAKNVQNMMKESKEILEDLIIAAHSDAKQKVKTKASEELSKITGGISLPPDFKWPF